MQKRVWGKRNDFQGAKALTSKRFVKLNPVFKDKVAIVFSVPEPGFPK